MVVLDSNRLRYGNYFSYFRGDMNALYGITPSQVNGLSYINGNEITSDFNYFAAVSHFFIDAMLGDIPETARILYRVFEELVTHWAVTGEYCIVITGTGIRIVRPDNIFPLPAGSPVSQVTDYLLVFPQIDPNGQMNGKATVFQFNVETGRATTNIRDYTPGMVGDVGTEPQNVDIFDVIWVDTGDGSYPFISGIVRELNVRSAMLSSSINSTSYPLLQANADSISGVKSNKDITISHINVLAKSGLGILLEPGFTGENEPKYIERSGAGLTESLEFIRLLLGQLSVLSGVPDYVYGVSLNQNPSEIERILFAGQSKISRLRRSLEASFARLGLILTFTTEPFSTRKSRLDGVRTLFTDGIITQEEARVALGWPAQAGV